MRAAIFTPHLYVGGMEKFALLTALELRRSGAEVDLLTDWSLPKRRLEEAFGISLADLRIRELGPGYARRLMPLTARCDLFINNSASHSFPPFARENWMWVHYLPKRDPKHLEYYRVFANSLHTQKSIRRLWGLKSELLYGPVATERFRPSAKTRSILGICKLNSASIDKNEIELVRLFGEMHRGGRLPGWTFDLAGVFDRPDRSCLRRIRDAAGGAPVRVHLNPTFEELRNLYGRASLFWSGTGARPSDRRRPRLMEHFGIAIVEAMAAGCVPLAFDGGGPREIILHGRMGWRYRNWEELARKTAAAASDPRGLAVMGARAKRSAGRFSARGFARRLEALTAPLRPNRPRR